MQVEFKQMMMMMMMMMYSHLAEVSEDVVDLLAVHHAVLCRRPQCPQDGAVGPYLYDVRNIF